MKNILSKIRDNHEKIFRLFLFVITLVVILYSFPRQAKFKYEFSKGQPWMHETIIAPFDFSILKSESELDIEKEIIKSQNFPIYNYSDAIFEIKAEEFVKLFEEKWVVEKKVNKDQRFTFKNLFKKKIKSDKSAKLDLVNFGYNYLNNIYTKGIIQLNNEVGFESNNSLLLKKGSVAESREFTDFYSINQVLTDCQ